MDQDWWRGAVIYQVYPRSFFDSNGDGIGDLPGVTLQLDYIRSLNVDAIWLSPFFTSPMKDFGYDIADYRDVDPIFGTLADFDTLLAAAHERGLKIFIDQVLSHTSDQHAWFKESRQSRENPKADWYVWADPKPDGTPPNNWLSVFGGPAWTWDTRRKQYYLRNFLSSQPDLNYHNPAVVNQILEEVKFWLEKGVDGFRFDAINYCFHDKQLRDNPPNTRIVTGSIGVRPDNPYAWQKHEHCKSQPENLEFLQRLRQLLDKYPGTASLGEIGCDDSVTRMAEYTSGGNKLNMAYSFDLLTEAKSASFLRETVEKIEAAIDDGWPCWAIGNHDVPRVGSRWADLLPVEAPGGEMHTRQILAWLFMLTTLRGSACIYQGEELGLTEAELDFEDLVDPYGITFWPEYKGRDGCRTPMPWDSAAPNAGFTAGPPWLPIPEQHRRVAVSEQTERASSVLNGYRQWLQARRGFPALQRGAIRFHDGPPDSLFFEREHDGSRLFVAINLSREPIQTSFPLTVEPAEALPAFVTATYDRDKVMLPPYGVGLAKISA
ncbi:alpha-amylase family glycosyl hydrolase [Allohahella marinimesophila]|uniref:Alpha-amylase family glycosyl hydrolase n=1 Tax=Allohahella marinimesophila TaxID=1054972 RepID=A0ABP7P823_9GAMM